LVFILIESIYILILAVYKLGSVCKYKFLTLIVNPLKAVKFQQSFKLLAIIVCCGSDDPKAKSKAVQTSQKLHATTWPSTQQQ